MPDPEALSNQPPRPPRGRGSVYETTRLLRELATECRRDAERAERLVPPGEPASAAVGHALDAAVKFGRALGLELAVEQLESELEGSDGGARLHGTDNTCSFRNRKSGIRSQRRPR